jgi:16S rRNA processing protein RimM
VVPQERSRRRPTPNPTNEPTPGFISVGIIRAARGVHGELRVESLTDVPGRFQAGAVIQIDGIKHQIARARTDRHGLLLTFEGIADRTAAEARKGKLLEVPETESPDLADGAYYRHQIVGLRVTDTAGGDLGRIEEILETGANDVFVVRDGSGETLIPALDSIVKHIDVAGGEMHVELVRGLERRNVTRSARRPPIQKPTSANR